MRDHAAHHHAPDDPRVLDMTPPTRMWSIEEVEEVVATSNEAMVACKEYLTTFCSEAYILVNEGPQSHKLYVTILPIKQKVLVL